MAITEAKTVKNALLAANFRYEETGFSAYCVIKAKPPKRSREVVELSGGGQTVPAQQAGGQKALEYELTCVFPAAGPERGYWEQRSADADTGDTSIYYKDATLTLLGPNKAPSMVWEIQDCWPEEPDFDDFETSDKKKMVQVKVKMRCNDYKLQLK